VGGNAGQCGAAVVVLDGFLQVQPRHSHERPLIQVTDRFVGMAVLASHDAYSFTQQ
jgi:hypothetical protein